MNTLPIDVIYLLQKYLTIKEFVPFIYTNKANTKDIHRIYIIKRKINSCNIPKRIKLTQIEELNIKCYNPSNLKLMTNLKKLDISNTFTNFICVLSGLINLVELDISCNNINSLEPLRNLKKLKKLNLKKLK